MCKAGKNQYKYKEEQDYIRKLLIQKLIRKNKEEKRQQQIFKKINQRKQKRRFKKCQKGNENMITDQ